MKEDKTSIILLNHRSGGGRLAWLDAIKFLGILLVIQGHVLDYGFKVPIYDSTYRMMFYSFNMPIFFFVSGYLAYKELLSPRLIISKLWWKFLFLVIPAVVFKLFMDLQQGLNSICSIQGGIGGYWFTITLFECFLLYYLIALIVRRLKFQMVSLSILAVVGIGLLSLYGEFGPKLLDMNRLTKYFQYFVFGLLAMRYKVLFNCIMKNEWFKAGTTVAFFSLLFTINQVSWPTPVFHLLRDLVLRYLGTFVIISFFVCQAKDMENNNFLMRTICNIGRYSLPIYLLQYFFIPRYEELPNFINDIDRISIYIVSMVYAIVIMMICMCFIKLLSNSKVIRRFVLGLNN